MSNDALLTMETKMAQRGRVAGTVFESGYSKVVVRATVSVKNWSKSAYWEIFRTAGKRPEEVVEGENTVELFYHVRPSRATDLTAKLRGLYIGGKVAAKVMGELA